MKTAEEVRFFLQEFTTKYKIFQIIFRDERGKNRQALLDLELTPMAREAILLSLEIENFSHTREDTLYAIAQLWVFGKMVKGTEVYIKISLGIPGGSVICISFHPSESPLTYPLKPIL